MVYQILSNKEIDSIDDLSNLGVYKPNLKNTKVIKDKIKKISKIINELKDIKNG